MGNPYPDLETPGVCRLVTEQDQVEGSVGRFQAADGFGEGGGGALRIPVDVLDGDEH